MKKTLVSALTTALVVGAASTTFAAANPFADVPADHWAYDAVAQLVQDGIINGYGDGTYVGDQNMSRYEMAQIVAKAMAKSEAADNNNKALIDKLAAEFSDELANLGVRVADLEAKTDNVKWQGMIRYDWTHQNFESNTAHSNANDNYIKLRFEPSMTINENWTGHARIDYDVQKDETIGGNNGKAEVKRLWTEGQYGKFDAKLGRFGTFSDNSHGLVMDTDVTGAEFTYAPTEAWKLKATAGRVDANDLLWNGKSGIKKAVINNAGTGFDAVDQNQSATYWAAEVDYANGKWDAGVGYRNFGATTTNQDTNKDSFHVIDLGAGYAFDKNVKLTADYAWGPGLSKGLEDAGLAKNAYNVQLSYKGANAADAGSWGAYVAYRSLAPFAAVGATYDLTGAANTAQGWEIGADYTFAKNIIATAKYFNGKDNAARYTSNGNGYNAVFTRVDFLF